MGSLKRNECKKSIVCMNISLYNLLDNLHLYSAIVIVNDKIQ